MRKAVVLGVLVFCGSAVLGATVLRQPLAEAASPFTAVIIGNTSSNPVPVKDQNLDGNGNLKVHEQGTASVNVANASLPVREQNVDADGNLKVREQGVVNTAQSGSWHVSLDGTPGVTSADTTTVLGSLAHDLAASSNYTVYFGDISQAKSVRVLAYCAGSACSNVKVEVDAVVNNSFYTIDEFSPQSSSTTPHLYDEPGETLIVSLVNNNTSAVSNVHVAVLGRAN